MYTHQLADIGIELLEPYKGAKTHHTMRCVACNHEWSATPISKVQNFKKWGKGGCPECTRTHKDKEKNIIRTTNIQKLKDRGIVVLDDWDGTTGKGKESMCIDVTVKNTNCGHTFTATSKNLLTRNVSCPICAREYKNSVLTASSKTRSEEWQKTATDWKIYKSAVTKLTRKNYLANKAVINPQNLPTGRAGVEGAYHIDHIVPIRYCYNNNIPEHICADPSNLQMLGWRENVGSRDKLKGDVPAIFEQFIASA